MDRTFKYYIIIKENFLFSASNDSMHVELLFLLKKDSSSHQFFIKKILGWSNSKQKFVKLDKPFYATLPKNEYKQIKSHYKKVAKNYADFLNKTIKTNKKLQDFEFTLKTLSINFILNF